MNHSFNALFDGQDEDTVPIRDTYFLKILHLSEDKHRHLMRLVLHYEIKREALCLSGASSAEINAIRGWEIPDEDYIDDTTDTVDFFDRDGVFVTSLFKRDEGREVHFIDSLGDEDSYFEEGDRGWVLHDSDYLKYLGGRSPATAYVLSLDPRGSRDKQVKAVQRWLKIWKQAHPSQRRAGDIRSVKASIINLACWRLWRKSRWTNSDEKALAAEIGQQINKILPQKERVTRLYEKQEIARRCRRCWQLISARLK